MTGSSSRGPPICHCRDDRQARPTENYMVIGEVVGVHIDESVLTGGLVDITKTKPVSRLGYMDYATTENVYQMFRPKWEREG